MKQGKEKNKDKGDKVNNQTDGAELRDIKVEVTSNHTNQQLKVHTCIVSIFTVKEKIIWLCKKRLFFVVLYPVVQCEYASMKHNAETHFCLTMSENCSEIEFRMLQYLNLGSSQGSKLTKKSSRNLRQDTKI